MGLSDLSTVPMFEMALFELSSFILQQDVDREFLVSCVNFPVLTRTVLSPNRRNSDFRHIEFIPFVYQLLAQLLELRPIPSLTSIPVASVPDFYKNLVPSLLLVTVWQEKGSVPGTALSRSYHT